MSSTTIEAFWTGFMTTTEEIVQANWGLFYMILASIAVLTVLTGIAAGITYFFKRR